MSYVIIVQTSTDNPYNDYQVAIFRDYLCLTYGMMAVFLDFVVLSFAYDVVLLMGIFIMA